MDEQPQPDTRDVERVVLDPPAAVSDVGGRLLALERRLGAVEEELRTGSTEIRTRRLTVLDDSGRARLVAEVVDDVTELRIEVPPAMPGRRTAVLLFGTGRSAGDLPAGAGLQVWADGDLAHELSWWGPER